MIAEEDYSDDDYAMYKAELKPSGKVFVLRVESTREMAWGDFVLAIMAWANDEDEKRLCHKSMA